MRKIFIGNGNKNEDFRELMKKVFGIRKEGIEVIFANNYGRIGSIEVWINGPEKFINEFFNELTLNGLHCHEEPEEGAVYF